MTSYHYKDRCHCKSREWPHERGIDGCLFPLDRCYLLCEKCKVRFFFGDQECPRCHPATTLRVVDAIVGYIQVTVSHRDWFTLRDGSKYEFIFGSPSSEWASIDPPSSKENEMATPLTQLLEKNPQPTMPARMKVVSETTGFVTSRGSLVECFEWYLLEGGKWKTTHIIHNENWILSETERTKTLSNEELKLEAEILAREEARAEFLKKRKVILIQE